MKSLLKSTIKKLLAWVLQDDLRKLRKVIQKQQAEIGGLERWVGNLPRAQIAVVHPSQEEVIEAAAVVSKWQTIERLCEEHKKAVTKLEKAYRATVKFPVPAEKRLPVGAAFHTALEAERLLWEDLKIVAKAMPPLERYLLEQSRQQWTIDFENPVV